MPSSSDITAQARAASDAEADAALSDEKKPTESYGSSAILAYYFRVFIMRRILVYKTEDPLVCSHLVKRGRPSPTAHVALSNRPELWCPPEILPLYLPPPCLRNPPVVYSICLFGFAPLVRVCFGQLGPRC